MESELHHATAVELLRAYRRKAVSPLEVTRHLLERIGRLNPQVNAFCRLDADGALEAARASEQRWLRGEPAGLLDGVPVSIKDLILVRGMPTLHGSRTVSAEQPWEDDAPATARLREQGAVILGKTCTPEFGHTIVTESPLTGITRNPWNLEHSPGGSSGGAAAALALGLGPLALGTDGGGSIRIPAAWSGLVGFKPSFGRVPDYPPPESAAPVSVVGPLARSVEDAALALTVIARGDPRDWYALPEERRDYRVGLEQGLHGLRIAYSPDMGLARVEPDIAACVARAVALLAEQGARVEAIEPPGIEAVLEAHATLKTLHLARMAQAMTPAHRTLLDPMILELCEAAPGLPPHAFQEALEVRARVGSKLQALHARFDLLVCPSFQVSAPAVPGLPASLRNKAPALTAWVNQSLQPAASVPCGLTGEGLPVGLQIVGPRYADALVLRAARAYEAARGPFPRPASALAEQGC